MRSSSLASRHLVLVAAALLVAVPAARAGLILNIGSYQSTELDTATNHIDFSPGGFGASNLAFLNTTGTFGMAVNFTFGVTGPVIPQGPIPAHLVWRAINLNTPLSQAGPS